MKERHQRSGMDLGVMGLAARCRHVFRWACTFIFVDLMWLLFRADSVGQAFFLYKRLLRADSFTLSKELTDGFILPEVEAILQVLRSLVLNVFGQDGQAARLVGAEGPGLHVGLFAGGLRPLPGLSPSPREGL